MPDIEQRSGHDRRKQPRAGAERRSAMPFIGEEQIALDGIRFLRDEIKAFVAEHGIAAAAYFERAAREWYGPLQGRVALLSACAQDRALERAWRISHAAGARAAQLLPLVVRHYFGESTVDRSA